MWDPPGADRERGQHNTTVGTRTRVKGERVTTGDSGSRGCDNAHQPGNASDSGSWLMFVSRLRQSNASASPRVLE